MGQTHFFFDELAPVFAHAFGLFGVGKQVFDGGTEGLRVAGGNVQAVDFVGDHVRLAAGLGADDSPFHRHRFEQRGYPRLKIVFEQRHDHETAHGVQPAQVKLREPAHGNVGGNVLAFGTVRTL